MKRTRVSKDEIAKARQDILDQSKAPPAQKVERTKSPYAPARWLESPMLFVDSYGWSWALTDDCQTVCAGRIEDVLKKQSTDAA